MPVAWRIVRESRASTAFDGEGAREFGGRWNSPGGRVVYTSATLSLAALETLVHLTQPVSLRHVAFRVEFDEALVEQVDASRLAVGWDAEPPGFASMAAGDDWLRRGRAPILRVPSAIVPVEFNYLLNPAHPQFRGIAIGKATAFAFDRRLIA